MKKEEKTAITKKKIIMAALKEFGTNGYTAGSLNNICKTGINKGLIYHNFKNKDALYLECVRKSCEHLIDYVTEHNAQESFLTYMNTRMKFFHEYEPEASIFLEARTNPPRPLIPQIEKIYGKFDQLNMEIFEKELSRHQLRESVSKEDALNYFFEIQKIYNLNFVNKQNSRMSSQEQLALHEKNICKIFDLMLYGIAKGGNEA